MKIRFLEDTYIRKAPRLSGEAPLGTLFRGTEIEVDPVPVQGDAIENNYHWYQDKNGWFYWSGRTEVTEVSSAEVKKGPAIKPKEKEKTPPPPHEAEPPPGEPIPPISPFPDTPFFTPEKEDPEKQPEDNSPALWQDPAPEKLNWGIRNYLIAEDWWQERGLTGKGVRIALLSTGISPDHPDLAHATATFQFSDGSAPMQDIHGLGTQAAVIAAGLGETVFGLAPESQLLIARIGEQDHMITPEGLLYGLSWAMEEEADIIAMLVDFPRLDEPLLEKLRRQANEALSHGILLLAPAGTIDNKKPEARYPACLEGVLSIGAHDQYGKRSSFSARSYQLDLLAPGEGLITSASGKKIEENTKSVAIAAAFTAGFLALVLQWQRNKGRQMAPEEVYKLLRKTAASRRTFNKGNDVEYGHGLLNPIQALKALDASYKGATDGNSGQ